MLDALKQYLTSRGYKDIYVDTLPDSQKRRDVIALFKWDHTIGAINDGTGVHYIQVQVRRATFKEALSVCNNLCQLLDSGTEEMVIDLTPDTFCIARPRRGPLKMESDNTHTTFYFELALWGRN